MKDVNVDIWENIYKSGSNNLKYPNENLVRISHTLLSSQKDYKILDFGFGTGANLIHFLDRGFKVSGVEVSQSALHIVKDKLSDLQYEAELKLINKEGSIPYEDNSFDVVIAWQVLTYNDWESLEHNVKEINRVLKPGGIFIGTITATGDVSHINSKEIEPGVFKSNLGNQNGTIQIIVDKDDVKKCFPDKELRIGEFMYSFEGNIGRHWMVIYEN